jgi:hypothetical protein
MRAKLATGVDVAFGCHLLGSVSENEACPTLPVAPGVPVVDREWFNGTDVCFSPEAQWCG